MRQIVRIKFGSHLYGTATPASDLDYKGVFIPTARDLLLQIQKRGISLHRAKEPGEKNVAGEIDEDGYALQYYLALLAEGQTVALDMLFAPDSAMEMEPAPEWQEVRANRERLLTRKAAAFVGYCRQQANKYGIKGSRVDAARKATAFLWAMMEDCGTVAKLATVDGAVRAFASNTDHAQIVDLKQASGVFTPHLEVCGRKMPFSASIKSAHAIMAGLVDQYGKRALQAEANQGVDWKALSHAVRVGRQALELLRDHRFTFPLPYAEHLVAIKTGRLIYQDVAAEIETLLAEVEQAALVSTLPTEPDHAWIADFVARVHRETILAG